ncbi:MAG: MarR family transcriptional regulator [Thermodesulfobacteriota bacterium]
MSDVPYQLQDSLGYLVHRVSLAMAGRLNRDFAAAGYDVTVEQWKVLVRLWDAEGATHAELSARIGKNKASITRLVDGLERRGLVKRVAGRRDRRCKRVLLTEAGRSLREGLMALVHAALAEAQAGIPAERMDLCKDVLRRVLGNISESLPREDA